MANKIEEEKRRVKRRAKYQCWSCKYEWFEDPGWQGTRDEGCSKCDNIYIEWLNYQELFLCPPIR